MPRPWNPRLAIDPELRLKPQVGQMSASLSLDRYSVVGRLLLAWVTAQVRAADDGTIVGKSSSWLNTLVECAGFAEAMAEVGWLQITPRGVKIPEFDTFVSKKAIRRMEATERRRDLRSRTGGATEPLSRECHANVTSTSPDSAPPTEPTPPPAKKPKATACPLFDRFWAAYPRKVGKADAVRAWAKLKVEEELLVRMLAAIERQSRSEQWVKNSGEFIPHPTTWLNGRRWEDESDVPGRHVQSGTRIRTGEVKVNPRRCFSSDDPNPFTAGTDPAGHGGPSLF